jgi:hypothetical protein
MMKSSGSDLTHLLNDWVEIVVTERLADAAVISFNVIAMAFQPLNRVRKSK